MKPINYQPPRLALVLLNKLLPDSVNDDISGDLIEEFNHSKSSNLVNHYLFWRNTLGTCWRYNMNIKAALSLMLALISIGIFYTLIVTITFLSNAEDTLIFDNAYWTNGAAHLAFFEAEIWQLFSDKGLTTISWQLFVNVPSILWFLFSCALLFCVDKKYSLSLKSFAILALAILSIPYLSGVAFFNLYDVPLNKSGPIIAFMWLSIMYLILPLSYGLIKKIYQQKSTILA